MTDDLDSSSAADEARVVAAATDWRSTVRMLGPRGARWSLPLADVLLGAACLLIVLSPLSFISRFGAHAVYSRTWFWRSCSLWPSRCGGGCRAPPSSSPLLHSPCMRC